MEKYPTKSKLKLRDIDRKLVSHIGTISIFYVYRLLQKKVNTLRQVKFILSNDYISIEIYLPLELTFSEPNQLLP